MLITTDYLNAPGEPCDVHVVHLGHDSPVFDPDSGCRHEAHGNAHSRDPLICKKNQNTRNQVCELNLHWQ